jgi:hypothetical protein
LPLRTVRISFPELDPTGKPYIRFEGFFGVQLSDPWWLWRYLRDRGTDIRSSIVSTADDSSDSVAYGTIGAFTPTPAPNGLNTVFSIPFGYISGTTEVYVNGLRYFPPTHYTESSPANGQITFAVAPLTTDKIYVIARLTGG